MGSLLCLNILVLTMKFVKPRKIRINNPPWRPWLHCITPNYPRTNAPGMFLDTLTIHPHIIYTHWVITFYVQTDLSIHYVKFLNARPPRCGSICDELHMGNIHSNNTVMCYVTSTKYYTWVRNPLTIKTSYFNTAPPSRGTSRSTIILHAGS